MHQKSDPTFLEEQSLPRFEMVLAAALARAQAGEQSLPVLGPLPSSPSKALDKIGQKIHGFTAFADAPRPKVGDVDQQFQGGEAELRQYLASIEALRKKLADLIGQ